MSGHTPGPWRVSSGSDRHVETLGGHLVALAEMMGGEDFIEHWGETQANARLIAEAPAMLALIKDLAKGPDLHACDTRGERNDARNQWLLGMREKAKAAIACAEGKS